MKQRVRARLDALLEKKQILIAAHRGVSGGNIMENTTRSNAAALKFGADIIEMDVARDRDGNYFVLHDGMEFRLFPQAKCITEMTGKESAALEFRNSNNIPCGSPCRLDDMLSDVKARGCLINVDRSWRYWDAIAPVFQRHDMFDQLLFKSPADEPFLSWFRAFFGDAMYMPIVYRPDDLRRAEAAGLNLVGAEILFANEDDPQASPEFLERLKKEGKFCWVNAITLGGDFNLSAHHDDDHVITGGPEAAEANWGWLIERGFNVIQTDWPLLLRQYLSGRS